MIKFKSIGMFIFGGSQTCGYLNTGWNVDKVLEMTEDMLENNSYHFIKNYPNIPVLKPSEWTQNDFLRILKNEQYDLLYTNNPCSGLSSINKNANVNQPINNKFFEVFNVINYIKPKTFLIENAPTLVTIGTPILKEMVNKLNKDYKFTIIRDLAGNHGVAMQRMRTLVIGWNREYFNNKLPIVNMNIQPITTVKDVLGEITEITKNNEYDSNRKFTNLIKFYSLISPNNTVLKMCCDNYNLVKNDLNKHQLKSVTTMIEKQKINGHSWDKSPFRLSLDKRAPSLTSLSQFIHPIENRDLYIREYARIMGYPEDFIFYPNECKCSTIQCIAQGVPVKFIEYISKEIKDKFENNYQYIEDDTIDIVYQVHTHKKYFKFKSSDFLSIYNNLNDINENGIVLEK